MKSESNFILTIKKESPIIISVPHGGQKHTWINKIFETRIPNNKKGRFVLEGDKNILDIAIPIIKNINCSGVIGLLPRNIVDYNRFGFLPEDETAKKSYKEYHKQIKNIITKTKEKFSNTYLFDFHGFGIQPDKKKEFDIIIGCCEGKTTPSNIHKQLYQWMTKKGYSVFCAEEDGYEQEFEMYRGDTTNLKYNELFGIDAILIEIAQKYRFNNHEEYSKQQNIELIQNFEEFFKTL